MTVWNPLTAQDWRGNITPTYSELMNWCDGVAKTHPEIQLFKMGFSDVGEPIHLLLINGGKDSLTSFQKARTHTTILVNNGIHPGEPDGINAMMIWVEKWIAGGKNTKNLPVIAFIPVYNVGGMLNRGSHSRTNQNGPEAYGFRGNARNFDLNRDFIKCDTKNTEAFHTIYHALEPDVFIDNHVSNGADYSYTLTYISELQSRLPKGYAAFLYEKMIPAIAASTAEDHFEMIPYVNTIGVIPDSGLVAFNDLPRYAMGYTSLFHTFSFTVETHMLKPFPKRVLATLSFFEALIEFVEHNKSQIEEIRESARKGKELGDWFQFNHRMIEVPTDSLWFKGYQADYPKSTWGNHSRLKYHSDQPFSKKIAYYAHFQPIDSVKVPSFIYLPTCESEVIEELRRNGVALEKVTKTGKVVTNQPIVIQFESLKRPYEGHFLHYNTKISWRETELPDYLSFVRFPVKGSPQQNWLMNVFIPSAPDSYFNWNYWDSYLDQKEYYSDYVFEDEAAFILQSNSELMSKFEKMKIMDAEFAASADRQLRWIYEQSVHFEGPIGRMPVYFYYGR